MRAVAVFGNKTACRLLTRKEAATSGTRQTRRNAGTGSRCDRAKLDRSARAPARRFGSHGTLGRGTRPFSPSYSGLPPRRPAFADFGPETGTAPVGLINAFDLPHSGGT